MPEYRVKTTTSGRPQFVRAQSFSHPRHHHHHLVPHLHREHTYDHHHLIDHLLPHDHGHYYRVEYRHGHRHHPRRKKCPINCACITLDEWTNLVESNRNYAELTKNLTEDSTKLKAKLQAAADSKDAADKENEKLTASNAQLAITVQQLQDENAELRRCLMLACKDDGSDVIERLRRRIRDQAQELNAKDGIIRGLEKQLGDLKSEVRELKHRLKHRHHHHHHDHCKCKQTGDAGASDSSSSDGGAGNSSSSTISALRKTIIKLEASVAKWQRRSEDLQKIALEFEKRYDTAKTDLARQTDLADRFRRRIHRLEDQLGRRERGVWFG